MSISLRLVIPIAAPCPVPPPRTARNAGCSPLSAAAVPVRTTGALRGCAALPLRPQSLVRPCRSRGSGIVCNASAYLSPPTTQWVSVAAAAVLLLAKGTGIHKSFLVPLFVLQAPTAVISWIKSEYGLWTAFLALVVRLFLPFPGELELPLSTMLAVSVAPYQVMNVSVLLASKEIGIHKSLLMPWFAQQAPSSVIPWIKREYGLWTAFLAILVRLFLPTPGELELPLSTMWLIIIAPYQVMSLRFLPPVHRGTQAGRILSLAVAVYLAFQYFTRNRGLRRAFRPGSIVATLAVICITVTNVILLF
ncbi:cold-regulated 413 inner membrane protein 2, chloroplastic isoform X1 [Triticum aestivum]|nr:cold-regulated 413 inner membrane protein 2, chloroplastic isoform X1 [Triticum aestivum]XP_044451837.1 cold-regulated 413 inner membrane protein 2, chloroplastic isoform X1 [Triticum aestivum]